MEILHTIKNIAPSYMVFVEGQHAPKFQHATFQDAEKEAIRLAKNLQSETFIVMQVKSFKPVQSCIATEFPYDSLPF